ncbi:hypothetical protein [Intrasporangium sp. YIM S08009]|uniref:hypothetical protein n=1 Tax=Intrasporangium zincisolvens TaxID=3080018 RepID=UPI002B056DB4|nr:hypothetical protein [Intrasporangium sp. YIM S08009]
MTSDETPREHGDDETPREHGDDESAHRRRTAVALVVSLVLVGVDAVFLGLSYAFGSGGFGGDRTQTPSELARHAVGEGSGLTALVIAAMAFAVVLSGRVGRVRSRAVVVLVVAQLVAVTVLVASTTS